MKLGPIGPIDVERPVALDDGVTRVRPPDVIEASMTSSATQGQNVPAT